MGTVTTRITNSKGVWYFRNPPRRRFFLFYFLSNAFSVSKIARLMYHGFYLYIYCVVRNWIIAYGSFREDQPYANIFRVDQPYAICAVAKGLTLYSLYQVVRRTDRSR